MGVIVKITALNLCQIPTVVARQNDARATQFAPDEGVSSIFNTFILKNMICF